MTNTEEASGDEKRSPAAAWAARCSDAYGPMVMAAGAAHRVSTGLGTLRLHGHDVALGPPKTTIVDAFTVVVSIGEALGGQTESSYDELLRILDVFMSRRPELDDQHEQSIRARIKHANPLGGDKGDEDEYSMGGHS